MPRSQESPSNRHKIRYLKTKTGENFSITLTRKAAVTFSGCVFKETILLDGILLTVGSGTIIEKHTLPSHLKYYTKI